MDAESLKKFVEDQIQKLRPKLLDFSRNNPLVATRLGERSGSTVRVVDELPFEIFQRLISGTMQLVPLPPLDDDPRDERSDEFQGALASARLSDPLYLDAVDQIDDGAEDAAERLIKIERELKDRLREELNLPPRQTKGNFSLHQHARNNAINPSYDLPTREVAAEDGRHTDNLIQTLLLPDSFARRIDSINTKCRTYLQETGIDVLKVAFGFLEWAESEADKHSFAPLILMPSMLDKRRTASGREFWVKGDEAVESNIVLTEKLRINWGIDFPQYEPGQDIESYFERIDAIRPKGKIWRVRRQVAVGVFPSARMAMYHDLAPDNWDFGNHAVVNALFRGGASAGGISVFGDDYPVDDPEIEAKVPVLVSDADSSQFSAIVDVMDGKNLAIEGPPGTGKSQTIVNTIAAAIAGGKKVLFVAEKTVALNVVWSRMQAYGLGEFVLPLAATRSSREDVIQSIRDRLSIVPERDLGQREENLRFFEITRSDLSEYAQTIGSTYGSTEKSVFELLWKQLSSRQELDGWPADIHDRRWPDMKSLTEGRLEELSHIADQLEEAISRCDQLSRDWGKVNTPSLDPYQARKTLLCAATCAARFNDVLLTEAAVASLSGGAELSEALYAELLGRLNKADPEWTNSTVAMARRLLPGGAIECIRSHILIVESLLKERQNLAAEIKDEMDERCFAALQRASERLLKCKLDSFDVRRLAFRTSELMASIEKCTDSIAYLRRVKALIPELADVSARTLMLASEIAESVPIEVLAQRTATLSDPAAWTEIRSTQKRKFELAQRVSQVKQQLGISVFPEVSVVLYHCSILTNASALSTFSKQYRESKRFYRSLTNRSKFDRSSAIAELRSLADSLQEVSDFNSDARLKNLLGERFNGLDTDFSAIIDVVTYYKKIETEFSAPDDRPIRAFLLEADRLQIKALPRPSTVPVGLDVTDIEIVAKRLQELEGDLSNHETLITSLRDELDCLRKPEGVAITKIQELAVRLAQFQKAWREVEADVEVSSLIGKTMLSAGLGDFDLLQKAIGLAENAKSISIDNQATFLGVVETGNVSSLQGLLTELLSKRKGADAELATLSEQVGCDPIALRGNHDAASFVAWLQRASTDEEGLIANSRTVTLKQRLSSSGFTPLVDALELASPSRTSLRRALRAIVAEAMVRDVYRVFGKSLAKFDGDLLNSLRARFANLDRSLVGLARRHLRSTLVKNAKPPLGNGYGPKSSWTELSLIENEANKQKRFISVRDLTARAGRALIALKPCWMMSPLAVAQYIGNETVTFDLVVIDEASQMTPENAVGALVRASQTMIVGDTNQLPPTSFFRKMIAVDEDEDDEQNSLTDESILERANSAFRPPRRLTWHYRSRHSSLIKLSNHEIYNNGLTIFPSASENDPTMGVELVPVDSSYSGGTNANEAAAMMAAISKHLREDKDRSLGVVTINQKQRDLLLEEFELAVSKDPRLAAFVSDWELRNDGLEPFFIKNLENVQGDERDVIFIGTVYGPDKDSGRVMQRFGPISGLAGRRRLNVLFSRAKQKIVTFSSLSANDIVADSAANAGAHMLRRWLEFSKTGVIEGGDVSQRQPDSPFEQYVIDQLTSIGCEPVPQVGAAGYFIDIGVRHPKWPHGYIMGIECDGAPYHSSKSARDRDRYRQEILEGLGWHLYRIWSTDWFQNPVKSSERLRKAIVDRLNELTLVKPVEQAQRSAEAKEEVPDEDAIGEPAIDTPISAPVLRLISKEDAEMHLIKLRENEIMEEFPDSDRERGLLRKSMIRALLSSLPQDETEFRANIPLKLRETMDPRQMKYLPAVLEITCQVKS